MASSQTSHRSPRSDASRWFTRAAIIRITWISIGLAVLFIASAVLVGFLAYGHFSRSIERAAEERLEAHAALAALRYPHDYLKSLIKTDISQADIIVETTFKEISEEANAAGLRRIAIFDQDGKVAIDSADIRNRAKIDHRFSTDRPDIDRAIESRKPRTSLLYDLNRPDGSTKVAKTSYAPVPVPEGDTSGTVFVAAVELPLDYDPKISALKTVIMVTVGAFSAFVTLVLALAVASFRRMHRHLQAQAQKAQLAELSAAIAHEIKNPLAAMLTGLQLLRRGGSAEVQDNLRARLEREVKLIDRIVRDFLAYARGVQRAPEPCTLGEVIAKARQQLTEEQEAILTVEADAGLDLVSDATALGQSLGNLCKNACDAAIRAHAGSGEGRETPRVVLAARVRGPNLEVEVRDNGGGIPESLRQDLFQPFASGGPGGTGLGLAIARRLLSDLQGSVTLANTGPAGTTFRVVIPRGTGRGKRTPTVEARHSAGGVPAAQVTDGAGA